MSSRRTKSTILKLISLRYCRRKMWQCTAWCWEIWHVVVKGFTFYLDLGLRKSIIINLPNSNEFLSLLNCLIQPLTILAGNLWFLKTIIKGFHLFVRRNKATRSAVRGRAQLVLHYYCALHIVFPMGYIFIGELEFWFLYQFQILITQFSKLMSQPTCRMRCL